MSFINCFVHVLEQRRIGNIAQNQALILRAMFSTARKERRIPVKAVHFSKRRRSAGPGSSVGQVQNAFEDNPHAFFVLGCPDTAHEVTIS